MEQDKTAVMRGGVPYAGGSDIAAALEGFKVERVLGRGSMGAVYLARRLADGELMAVKVLDPGIAKLEKVLQRFEREAALMLELDHPNIARAYGVGARADCHYLCMEYIHGETLAAWIHREGMIDETAALRLMRQVADALAYGERMGVVHRDLKPENIIIREDGICKLVDMGLAILAHAEDLRLTAAGTALGTPRYMSPEQATAVRDLDTRADIYSFGCLFYHALCGRPPFPGEDGIQVMRAHVYEEPPRPREVMPGLREDIEAVILKCMEKDREKRYQSGLELVQTIDLVMFAAGIDAGRAGDVDLENLGAPKSVPKKEEKPPLSKRLSDRKRFRFDGSSPPGGRPS